MSDILDIGTLTGRVEMEDYLSPTFEFIEKTIHKAGDTIGEYGIAVAGALTVATGAVAGFTASVVALGVKGAVIEDVASAFDHLSEESGQTGEVLLGKLREGVLGTIDNFELMKTANRALQGGVHLTGESMLLLGQTAQAMANATGGTTLDALERLNLALLTGQTRTLRMAGILVDVEGSEKKFAASIGTTKDMLNAEGVTEAHRQGMLEAMQKRLDLLGVSAVDFQARFERAEVAVHNWWIELERGIGNSKVLNDAMQEVGDVLTRVFAKDGPLSVNAIVHAIEGVATELVNAVKWLVNFGHTVKDYWDSIPDWFKRIASYAAVAAGSIYVLDKAVGVGFDWAGKIANFATITSGVESLSNMVKLSLIPNFLRLYTVATGALVAVASQVLFAASNTRLLAGAANLLYPAFNQLVILLNNGVFATLGKTVWAWIAPFDAATLSVNGLVGAFTRLSLILVPLAWAYQTYKASSAYYADEASKTAESLKARMASQFGGRLTGDTHREITPGIVSSHGPGSQSGPTKGGDYLKDPNKDELDAFTKEANALNREITKQADFYKSIGFDFVQTNDALLNQFGQQAMEIVDKANTISGGAAVITKSIANLGANQLFKPISDAEWTKTLQTAEKGAQAVADARNDAVVSTLFAEREAAKQIETLHMTGTRREVTLIQQEWDAKRLANGKMAREDSVLLRQLNADTDALYQHRISLALHSDDTIVERMEQSNVLTRDLSAEQTRFIEEDFRAMGRTHAYTMSQMIDAWSAWRQAVNAQAHQGMQAFVQASQIIEGAVGGVAGRFSEIGDIIDSHILKSVGGVLDKIRGWVTALKDAVSLVKSFADLGNNILSLFNRTSGGGGGSPLGSLFGMGKSLLTSGGGGWISGAAHPESMGLISSLQQASGAAPAAGGSSALSFLPGLTIGAMTAGAVIKGIFGRTWNQPTRSWGEGEMTAHPGDADYAPADVKPSSGPQFVMTSDKGLVPWPGGKSDASTPIKLYLDGRQIAQALVPLIPGEVRRLGLA